MNSAFHLSATRPHSLKAKPQDSFPFELGAGSRAGAISYGPDKSFELTIKKLSCHLGKLSVSV